MTELTKFIDWFIEKVDPDWFKLSKPTSGLAVWDVRFCEECGGQGLASIDPIAYTELIYGPASMEVERFDDLVNANVRKAIAIEVIKYYDQTHQIEWKRACKRFLSKETYADVFPTE